MIFLTFDFIWNWLINLDMHWVVNDLLIEAILNRQKLNEMLSYVALTFSTGYGLSTWTGTFTISLTVYGT